MLVWGHWRLGRNRLCIYPLPVFFASRCWFKSSPGNARQKKNFWSSSHKMHIYSVMLNKGGGYNHIDTDTLGSWCRSSISRVCQQENLLFPRNLILPPASRFNARFVIRILFIPCLFTRLPSVPPSLPFFLYWLYIKNVLHTTARCDWSESMLQSNRLLIWPTSAADT